MTLNIPLSPETEAKLRAQAAAAEKDVETFVRETVEETSAEPQALSLRERRTTTTAGRAEARL